MIIVADDAVENGIPNIVKSEILLSSELPIPPGKRERAPIRPEDKWINADSLKFIFALKLFKIKKKLTPSRIQDEVPSIVEITITLKLSKGLVLRFIIKLPNFWNTTEYLPLKVLKILLKKIILFNKKKMARIAIQIKKQIFKK